MIQKISISDFISLRGSYPVFDVRSPGEFQHAHIPGAYSLPLFTDEERAVVGTLYKQQGKQKAVKAGLDYFGTRMRAMLEEVEKTVKAFQKTNPSYAAGDEAMPVIVHCWRGGMRSAGVAWLLDLYGFRVYTLVGGYKAYRKWALSRFEDPYDFRILGGYTGSAKTDILEAMRQEDVNIINLEALAHHKGSAFGAMGQAPQPSQEMFENKLALELYQAGNKACWLEDESQRIGKLTIPHALWRSMRQSPVFFLDIPFEQRLDYIVKTYGGFEQEKYVQAVLRIQKRLGPMETKTTIGLLLENNIREAFRILLAYYDKTYLKSLQNREKLDQLLYTIPCHNSNSHSIIQQLLTCASQVSLASS